MESGLPPMSNNPSAAGSDPEKELQELRRRLSDSESRWRSFVSLTHEAFCCIEFDPPVPTHLPLSEQAAMMLRGKISDCNPAWARLFGAHDPGELIGSHYMSILGTAGETMIQRAKRLIRSGYHVEGVHNTDILKDGAERHFVNTTRGEITDGELCRIWVTSRDVTERTMLEQAAARGEAELCRTAEKLDSAFWVMDWDKYETLYSGPAIQDRWGVSRERMHDDPLCWLELVHEHDRRRVRDAFLTHAPSGSLDETFRVNLPDGSVGWVRNRCFVLPDSADGHVRLVGLLQDVSEFHRAQTGLRRLFDVSTEMLFVMDLSGRLVQANPALLRALQYSPEEITETSLLSIVYSDDHSLARQVLSSLNSGHPAAEVHIRFCRRDDAICPVEWSAAPPADDRLIYAAARDISGELADDDRRAQQNEAVAQLSCLSPRERQIADQIVTGKANKVIAGELGLSKRTVETHRANLMKKLKLQSAAELVSLLLRAAD